MEHAAMKKSFKKIKIIFFSGLFFLLLNLNLTYAQTAQYDKQNDRYLINFPAGSMFKDVLQQNISTSNANLDDRIELVIAGDLQLGDVLAVPKNSVFSGRIIRLGRAQQGKNGYFVLMFDILKLADGHDVDITGHIWTREGTGIIGGENTERIGYRKMRHSLQGIGDIVQFVPYGERIMGKETDIRAGSEFIIVLDKTARYYINQD